jgi:AcrR family transcriptional regulator
MTPAAAHDRTKQRSAPRRAGRPSVSEAQDLERAVLKAALTEFRVHGFSGASIERIAKDSGVTRSAIYRRYTSRQTLFQRVIAQQIALLEDQASELMRSASDPLETLRLTAQAYCRFVVSPVALDLQRIVVWEAAATDQSRIPKVPALPINLSDPIDRLVAGAQATGQLRAGPVALWRDALLRLVAEGPRWQALASGEPWDEARLNADFDRMWPLFVELVGHPQNA